MTDITMSKSELDYKIAIRDIRHALAECKPDQQQEFMNATPQI